MPSQLSLNPYKLLTSITLILSIVGWIAFNSKRSVKFESLESTTEDQKAVFNQIQFEAGWEQDIWIMRQSQHGIHLSTFKTFGS